MRDTMQVTNVEKTDQVKVYQPGSQHVVGDGFHVRNLFPSNDLDRELSPFIMLDYAGPTFYPATETPRGVGEHPHRGFETVTIVYQGRRGASRFSREFRRHWSRRCAMDDRGIRDRARRAAREGMGQAWWDVAGHSTVGESAQIVQDVRAWLSNDCERSDSGRAVGRGSRFASCDCRVGGRSKRPGQDLHAHRIVRFAPAGGAFDAVADPERLPRRSVGPQRSGIRRRIAQVIGGRTRCL